MQSERTRLREQLSARGEEIEQILGELARLI
jgi:hypothetical protein